MLFTSFACVNDNFESILIPILPSTSYFFSDAACVIAEFIIFLHFLNVLQRFYIIYLC